MNLAVCIEMQGKPATDVEPWYRKALSAFEASNDRVNTSLALTNLANLLLRDPQRLHEARDLATQALAIKQTLDPGATEIWMTYRILAHVAAQQGDAVASRRYRTADREAYAAAPIAREALRTHLPLVGALLAALRQPSERQKLEQLLEKQLRSGWGNLVSALRAVLDRQRDEEALCGPLDREDSLIVMTILRYLADPAAEQVLFSDQA
jgi:hypothetical protein